LDVRQQENSHLESYANACRQQQNIERYLIANKIKRNNKILEIKIIQLIFGK